MDAVASHGEFQEHVREEFEEPPLEREQFMKGGRDIVALVWSMLALVTVAFIVISALVGKP
jgi:hypothetical protein